MPLKIDWDQATGHWQSQTQEQKSDMHDRLMLAVADRLLVLDSPWGDRWLRASVFDPWRVIPKHAVLNMTEAAGLRLGTYQPEVRRDMLAFLGEKPSAAFALRIVASNGDVWERASKDAAWEVETS